MDQPSRLLNEKSGFLGLSVFDLTIVTFTLVMSHAFFEKIGLGILSFLVAGVVLIALMAVRFGYRRKVIRDFLKFHFSMRGIYDPRRIITNTKPH